MLNIETECLKILHQHYKPNLHIVTRKIGQLQLLPEFPQLPVLTNHLMGKTAVEKGHTSNYRKGKFFPNYVDRLKGNSLLIRIICNI